MTSQILQEGILDVKAPKGSDDRKLWKVWRSQWTCFSVVYPSGRREPYLVIELANNSSKNSHRQITVSRDGLRLFRCTSRSRPFRTWAIMSGEKPLLYFAAESEVGAQEWMQSLRDGLWPPCFPFQMLTACSHEVSLIDDENTFLAGHLGVYGRLVLTSEDVISLMHPHWGAALLQISLVNIKDVLLLREAEVPPAGVFRIVLKCVEGSKVKALYFYSATAMEAIQWILGKVLSRSMSDSHDPEKRKLSKSNSNQISSTDKCLIDFKNEHKNISLSTKLHCTDKSNRDELGSLINVSNKYKNSNSLENSVHSLSPSSTESSNKAIYSNIYGTVQKHISKEVSEQHTTYPASKDVCLLDFTTKTVDLKNNSPNLSANIRHFKQVQNMSTETKICCMGYSRNESSSISSNSDYENLKFLSESSAQTNYASAEHNGDATQFVKYAVMNKRNSRDISGKEKIAENDILKDVKYVNENNRPSSNNQRNCIANITLDTSNIVCNNKETDLLSATSITEIDTSSSTDDKNREFPIKCSKRHLCVDANNSQIYYKNNMSSNAYSSQNGIENSNEQIIQQLTNGYKADNKAKMEYPDFFLNAPGNFLNTSISSVRLNNKSRDSSSSDEDFENPMLWTIYNGDLDDSGDHVYEDLLERKGTIYEEIDESYAINDEVIPHRPPLIPDRPKNLEIPSSLRLKKLSINIQETLDFVETLPTQKKYTKPKLIKKIDEANRVMHY